MGKPSGSFKIDLPDRTLENEMVRKGVNVQLLWQIRGPKDTAVQWISMYLMNKTLVCVHTYDYGWESFVQTRTLDVSQSCENVYQAIKE